MAQRVSNARRATPPPAPPRDDESEEEDDYLSMTFADPSTSTSKKETLTALKKRKAHEAEIRARPKSKKEIAVEEAARRDAALASSTMEDTSSKGFKLMARMGYRPGTTLGVGWNGLKEPVGLEMKIDKGGIGADAEKKRKIREQVERQAEEVKKARVEEGDFRERQARDREERRMQGQVYGAQKVCERLDEENEMENDHGSAGVNEPSRAANMSTKKPLSQINVLWRGVVKQRALAERDKRMRYDLQQSLSRLPTYDDPNEDVEDKLALMKKEKMEEVDLDLDQEDEELEAFEALDLAEKLNKLVRYLRKKWQYCFWCKYRYPDEEMEGCPGTTEEEHD